MSRSESFASLAASRRWAEVMGLAVVLLTFFFITPHLLPAGAPGRDNPNHVVGAGLLNGVRDQNYQDASNHARGLPAPLRADPTVLLHECVGSAEDMPCKLERDA